MLIYFPHTKKRTRWRLDNNTRESVYTKSHFVVDIQTLEACKGEYGVYIVIRIQYRKKTGEKQRISLITGIRDSLRAGSYKLLARQGTLLGLGADNNTKSAPRRLNPSEIENPR